MLTDRQQRLREQTRADAILTGTGYVRCRGYLPDQHCLVMIPQNTGRTMCYGCVRSRQQAQHATLTAIPSVGAILDDMEPIRRFTPCACGGDADGKEHLISLLHLRFLDEC